MKSTLTTLSIICVLIITACNDKKTALVTNISPNKQVTTKVTATRPSAVDPWKVEIKVKAYDFKEGYLSLEVYSDDINDKNVTFDWKDDKNCLITIQQRDGAPRKFQLLTDSHQVQLGEI
ncbi:MAG: hypothetical protein JWO06_3016 [Bacteroidota bacterium]|nr:hypothetical protein [Bacteroidota bacterium]